MKAAPLNRLQYFRNLGIGINSFGHIFCPVEFLEKVTEKKKKKGPVPAGPEQPQAAGPAREAAQRTGARARARFKPDGRGPGVRT